MRRGRARRIGLQRPCRAHLVTWRESRAAAFLGSPALRWLRSATVGNVPASRVAGRVECRYRLALKASDCFSAATDPTGPVSGASCRGPEGDSLKRSTWLNSGVEEWRSIATATKATLRSSIFRVKQDNSKGLSASPWNERHDRS